MKKKFLVLGPKSILKEFEDMLKREDISLDNAANYDIFARKIKMADLCIIQDKYLEKQEFVETIHKNKKKFIVLSSSKSKEYIDKAILLNSSDYIIQPFNYREFLIRINSVLRNKIRICCIGGGTGLFNLLMGIKSISGTLLTSIVSMSDDGGSSGKLKADFGILPPGDIRRSLIALSNAPLVTNEVMQYRFEKGEGLKGHNLGNLFLTALTEIKGSMAEAVRNCGDILNIQGIVLPVTSNQTTLCAQFENGKIIKGEHKIDLAEERNPNLHIDNIWHEPQTQLDTNAYSSLLSADIIIIGPGDLFTSIITNFAVKGLTEAIKKSKAKKIYICNLMTKPGETANYESYHHIRDIVKFLGGDFLDYIIASNTKLSESAKRKYAQKHQYPVKISDEQIIRQVTKAKIITADSGHETLLVRHDISKIRREIQKILTKLK